MSWHSAILNTQSAAPFVVSQTGSHVYDTINGSQNKIVKLDDTHIAVITMAYQPANEYGNRLEVFEVIGDVFTRVTNTILVSGTASFYNSMVVLDANHLLLTYQANDYQLHVMSISYDVSYIPTIVDDFVYSTYAILSSEKDIKIVDDTHFIIAAESNSDVFLYTFSLDASYNITQTSSGLIDSNGDGNCSLAKINNTHWLLAYRGSGSDGFIKTFLLTESFLYQWNIDSVEHDTSRSYMGDLVGLDATRFAYVYTGGSGTDIILKIFTIDGAYNITETANHTLSNEGFLSFGCFHSLLRIDDTRFAVIYTEPYTFNSKIQIYETNYTAFTLLSTLDLYGSKGYNDLIHLINDSYVGVSFDENSDGRLTKFKITEE